MLGSLLTRLFSAEYVWTSPLALVFTAFQLWMLVPVPVFERKRDRVRFRRAKGLLGELA